MKPEQTLRDLQSLEQTGYGPIDYDKVPLLDKKAVCFFFGGNKPIDVATLYRGVSSGRYPKPVKVGPGSSRWLRAECEAALQAMVDGRGR
jgi:predicted DNA-binding transcriptional regulator AlpA